MKLDLECFDLEKLLNDSPIVLSTQSLKTIEQCCRTVQDDRLFFGITGEPGFGKSLAFKYYKNNNENVYFITIEQSMSSRSLYFDLAKQLGVKEIDFKTVQLNSLIRSVSYALNHSGARNLIILDEAGKFTAKKLLYLHELRDATDATTGIIIAGPIYFRRNIEELKDRNKQGIPELFRRIQSWVSIDPPTDQEKTKFCEEKGIKDPYLIKAFIKESATLSELENRVIQARVFARQEMRSNKDK